MCYRSGSLIAGRGCTRAQELEGGGGSPSCSTWSAGSLPLRKRARKPARVYNASHGRSASPPARPSTRPRLVRQPFALHLFICSAVHLLHCYNLALPVLSLLSSHAWSKEGVLRKACSGCMQEPAEAAAKQPLQGQALAEPGMVLREGAGGRGGNRRARASSPRQEARGSNVAAGEGSKGLMHLVKFRHRTCPLPSGTYWAARGRYLDAVQQVCGRAMRCFALQKVKVQLLLQAPQPPNGRLVSAC